MFDPPLPSLRLQLRIYLDENAAGGILSSRLRQSERAHESFDGSCVVAGEPGSLLISPCFMSTGSTTTRPPNLLNFDDYAHVAALLT